VVQKPSLLGEDDRDIMLHTSTHFVYLGFGQNKAPREPVKNTEVEEEEE